MNKLFLNEINQKTKPRERPKRLSSLLENWKYFFTHSSLHGIKYVIDGQLFIIERFIWCIAVMVSFSFAVKITMTLYRDFQVNHCFISKSLSSYSTLQLILFAYIRIRKR